MPISADDLTVDQVPYPGKTPATSEGCGTATCKSEQWHVPPNPSSDQPVDSPAGRPYCHVLNGRNDQVREARRLVADYLQGWPAEARNDAVLLTSELVTNAVRHTSSGIEKATGDGDGQFAVTVEVSDRDVRVEVFDSGTPVWVPRPSTPAGDLPGIGGEGENEIDGVTLTPGGRGLSCIVDELTDGNWGYRNLPSGRVTWFVYTRSRP